MADELPYRVVVRPDEMTARAGASAAAQAQQIFRQDPVRSVLGRILREPTAHSNWKKGAKGEALIGKELGRLRKDRWKIFHDIPLGPNGVNVDHLIIGAGGVYSVNTKNLSGRVWLAERALLVNGHRKKYLQAAYMEAKNVARCLSKAADEEITVTPMLVIMCEELTRKAEPADVVVLRRKQLVRWLERRPEAIGLAMASRIARAAGMSSTWE